ncbi:uncharacterized protein IWZ02DRAFT_127302 [Phyllosticta citriasiana]|uniref:uncharacterized protein n=1 Tax=Phyllosticta citriasiana TaxID=595635 RepID=UPI0030FDBD87
MRELTGSVRWLTISLPVWLPQTFLCPPAGSTVSPPFSFVGWILCGVNETLSPPFFFGTIFFFFSNHMCALHLPPISLLVIFCFLISLLLLFTI